MVTRSTVGGIYGYAAAALVALVLSLSELRREEGPSPLQLTLPPLLALWVAGLYCTTNVLWAEFAPWLDDDGLFAALNLVFALVGCGLALGYRWPELLTIWAGGQGLLLLTNPGLLSTILRYGARWDREGLALLLLPLTYGLSALALGYGVRRRRLILWLAPFFLAGIAAVVVPIWGKPLCPLRRIWVTAEAHSCSCWFKTWADSSGACACVGPRSPGGFLPIAPGCTALGRVLSPGIHEAAPPCIAGQFVITLRFSQALALFQPF